MIEQTILHYKILKKLGEGGMGAVYLADDTKLGRKVAIKFLPGHISADSEERERFIIEARAAASLNHPNIAQIYSIEETNEDMFIVMEYIEGKDLEAIIKDTRLDVNEIISYAVRIAEGMDAAHRKGIIHRDIKPSNIMITSDGNVKIMDFGLAKVKGGEKLTKIGTTVGTAAYMSPEQAKGEEVDSRTDIWSFGVVLYEMLTGHLPFAGDYDQAVIYAVLNEKPESISSFRKDLAQGIERIVNKTLEKEPAKRYKDFNEILVLLNALRTYKKGSSNAAGFKLLNRKFIIPAAAILILFAAFVLWKVFFPSGKKVAEVSNQIERIAVLPFDNVKNDPKTNFLGFALADQIIGALAYDNKIVVRPSSAVRQYQNKDITPVKAGHQLNVDYILDGSYLKDADLIRLNLELVNTHNDEIVWRNDFDVKYENTFKLQDLVSKKVTTGLKLEFSHKRKRADVPKNSLAYEYYLKAISLSGTIEKSQKAIVLLKKAIQLDSTYAPVYVALGNIYDYLAYIDPTKKGKKIEAEHAYEKALSLDGNLLSALNGLAGLYNESGKQLDGVKLAERALEINPNDAGAYFALSYIFRYTGLMDRAIKEGKAGEKIDSTNRLNSLAITYDYAGRYKDALDEFRSEQNDALALNWKADIYLHLKNFSLAKKYLKRSLEIENKGILNNFAKAQLYYLDGKRKKAIDELKLLQNTLKNSEIYDGEVYYSLAKAFSLDGDVRDCVKLLKETINHGFYNYPLFLTDPFLNSARSDPDFKSVLEIAKNKSEEFTDELLKNSLITEK